MGRRGAGCRCRGSHAKSGGRSPTLGPPIYGCNPPRCKALEGILGSLTPVRCVTVIKRRRRPPSEAPRNGGRRGPNSRQARPDTRAVGRRCDGLMAGRVSTTHTRPLPLTRSETMRAPPARSHEQSPAPRPLGSPTAPDGAELRRCQAKRGARHQAEQSDVQNGPGGASGIRGPQRPLMGLEATSGDPLGALGGRCGDRVGGCADFAQGSRPFETHLTNGHR